MASSNRSPGAVNGAPDPAKPAYYVAERGPNSKVWKSVVTETNAVGKVFHHTNSFTQLATGLEVNRNGQYVDATADLQIAPDGSAAYAINTQHRVGMAANLNTNAAVSVVLPTGERLQSTVLGLCYQEITTGSKVVIANLQDSTGQVLPSLNQVVYTNALSDSGSSFYADVLYTHRLNGFEQDIILRQQPPAPEEFGMASKNTHLQVWTEFFNSPEPAVSTSSRRVSVSPAGAELLDDEKLDFGSMRMGRGNAFSSASATNSAADIGAYGMMLTPVVKHWVHQDGRTFLVEEVPIAAIVGQLDALPPSTTFTNGSSGSTNSQSFFRSLKPAQRQAKMQPMRLAKADIKQKPGFQIDYDLINTSVTNFVFQSDTTYYIQGTVNVYGTATFEGGTVIKEGHPNGMTVVQDEVNWLTSPYRPAVFTCTNDNSVGTALPGSTGVPNLADTSLLYCPEGGYVHDARFCYAGSGYSGGSNDVEVWNCQFVDCSHPITVNTGTTKLGLHNVLILMNTNLNYAGNVGDTYGPFALTIYSSGVHIYGENVTADLQTNRMIGLYNYVSTPSNCPIAFTNSILLSPLLNPIYYSGSSVGITVVTNCTYFASANPGTLFQRVGAASYYLAANSPYRDAGTSNINPTTLSYLAQKTTYPPVVFQAQYLTNDLVLFPQAGRDSGDNPDYGYHYDPLDYAFGWVISQTNVSIVANPGTAIGFFGTNLGTYGLVVATNGSFVSQGVAQSPNRLVEYNTVQEQSSTNWFAPSFCMIGPFWNNPSNITINCRFTEFSVMAQDANHINGANDDPTPINLRDCEIHGGMINSWWPNIGINLTNCLLERVNTSIIVDDDIVYGNPVFFQNNLIWGGAFQLYFTSTNSVIQDNMFYNTDVEDYTSTNYVYGYNGFYNTGNTFLVLTNSTDKFLTNDPGYQVGPLGNYYLPTNNTTLIHQGSTNANLLGFYHYCITTNQVKETTNIVSVGYHYVALGTNGPPVDTNGDGIPDYLSDANGNGLVDSGEIAWNVVGDLGLNVIITHPHNNSILP